MSKDKLVDPAEKHKRIMEKYSPIYADIANELQLSGEPVEQIHKLVQEGCKLQKEICTNADKIKIT